LTLYQDPNQVQRQAAQRVPGRPSRPELVTALDLRDHLQRHLAQLPREQATARVTSEADYWAIVTFMLIAHDADVPQAGVTPDNAATTMIRR
jgi:hypothetical protein